MTMGPKSKSGGKIAAFVLVLCLVALFFATGMHHRLTLESIKASREGFQEIYAREPLKVIAGFTAVYIPVTALNLPGAAVLGLAAGALFGTLTGTLLISFASSIGATLACALSRYLLRDWVQARFGGRLSAINTGVREEGAFYLFSLRLIPVVPFFLINMGMGLTPMRLWTFYWVSQAGMLPGTAVYVNAGARIAGIDSLAGILSPGLILSLALLGLFPLAMKKILSRFRRAS